MDVNYFTRSLFHCKFCTNVKEEFLLKINVEDVEVRKENVLLNIFL